MTIMTTEDIVEKYNADGEQPLIKWIPVSDIHNILADYYDERYKQNELNAKKNISKVILDLKKRIDNE